MPADEDPRIVVRPNGPYRVSGGVPLKRKTIGCDEEGTAVEWLEGEDLPQERDVYLLCRCGASSNKPYCDGTHARIDWDGAETASRVPYLQHADVIDGPAVTLTDDRDLCAEARFCDAHGGLWNRVARTDETGEREGVVEQTALCPAGRYVAWDNESGTAIEPDLPVEIAVVADPAKDASGPLWVRAGIVVEGADGEEYETRNRVTLCRCGASKNKPFCDGSHLAVGFKEG